MAEFGINSNVSAIRALTDLERSGKNLSKSFERLSAGLKINRGSDDAIGLQLASKYNIENRVYAEAANNVSNAVSRLDLANESLTALKRILESQKELATEASNPNVSGERRVFLQEEAKTLTEDFNKIISSTEFSGAQILDESETALTIQAGFGATGQIDLTNNDRLSRALGDGTVTSNGFVQTSSTSSTGITYGDVNGDGRLDIAVGTGSTGNSIDIFTGDGNGNFTASTTVAVTGGFADTPKFADFDGDGDLDLVATGTEASVYLNDGSGNFGAETQYDIHATSVDIFAKDVSGDGIVDIVSTNADRVDVLLGNGDGTFQAALTYTSGYGANYSLADFNGDGAIDIINGDAGEFEILFNNGAGGFSNTEFTFAFNYPDFFKVADINTDGHADLIYLNNTSDRIQTLLGNGDGTFRTGTFSGVHAGNFSSLSVGDVTGDGIYDVVSVDSASTFSISVGNGDGSFAGATSFAVGGNGPVAAVIADFDSDGVGDYVYTNGGLDNDVNVYLSDTNLTTDTAYLDLSTTETAQNAVSYLDKQITRVTREQDQIRADLKALGSTFTFVSKRREELGKARDQIQDVDSAREIARNLKLQIQNKGAAAVLSNLFTHPQQLLALIG